MSRDVSTNSKPLVALCAKHDSDGEVVKEPKKSEPWSDKFTYADACVMLGLWSKETADSYKQEALTQHNEQMAKSDCSAQQENADSSTIAPSKPVAFESNKQPTGDYFEPPQNM